MIVKSITCDNCGEELVVDSSYPHKWSLELRCIDTGTNTTGSEFAVYQKPKLSREMHYCGTKCLKDWVNKN